MVPRENSDRDHADEHDEQERAGERGRGAEDLGPASGAGQLLATTAPGPAPVSAAGLADGEDDPRRHRPRTTVMTAAVSEHDLAAEPA